MNTTTKLCHFRSAMSNSRNLPQEIITDILSRLPVKSLLRFKCVSPLWKSLISDPHFAKTHLDRTMAKNSKYPAQKLVIVSGCCGSPSLNSVDYNNVNPTSTKLDFLLLEQHNAEKDWLQVLNSCNGLLQVACHKSLFLLNPCTRECKKLPTCRFARDCLGFSGFGYDSLTDDYKVLMLAYDHIGIIVAVYLYSLKSNAWRNIEDPKYPFFSQNNTFCAYLVRSSGGVFFNGCLHYLGKKDIEGSSRVIIAFYLSGQFSMEMPLPTSSPRSRLVVFGGSLCLVDEAGREVWMMKEYGAIDSWTKFQMYSGWHPYVIDMLAEDEFLLLEANGVTQLVVYNSQNFTKTKRDIVICAIPSLSFGFGGTYVESLVSPFHGGGIG